MNNSAFLRTVDLAHDPHFFVFVFYVLAVPGSNSVHSSPVKSPMGSPSPQLISRALLLDSPDAEEPLMFVSSPETSKDKSNPSGSPTFFRSVVFSPEVPIRLDYQGKRVDMDQVGPNNFKT